MNAIKAGLRTLEVTRASVVLKACLVFSAFLLTFEYHFVYYLPAENVSLKQFTSKLKEN